MVPLPLPLLNMICTNVPGSPTPLYTVGRRLIASYPHVPTGYELGVGVAVQSYDGKLFFGLTADAHVVPDVARLRDYIQTCFRELVKAAGVKSATRAPRSRRAKREETAKPAEPAGGAVPTNGAVREAPVPTPPTESLDAFPATGAAVEAHAVEAEPVLV
jgi:hypothetical protein